MPGPLVLHLIAADGATFDITVRQPDVISTATIRVSSILAAAPAASYTRTATGWVADQTGAGT